LPTPLFNPDHSTSVLLENGQNPAIRESFTIAQILNFASTLGCDSVVIRPDFVNYDQTPCYYLIYAFNLGELNEYYVASGDWYDTNPETQSDILIQSITGATGFYEQCKVITLRNDGLMQSNTVQFNTITALKTKDTINYLDFNWSIYDRQTDPYIFATNADIGTLYINGSPLVTYQWSSVPAVSGKNGILRLSTLVDINDGNPVETTDTTKFTLTSASNVKTLVDAVPLGSIPASGGGASGSNPQYGGQTITGKSGTQESGYAFGQGGASGGGGGFYGGYGAEDDVSPAGAGSGYIGNPLLSNKKMYGYGVSKVTTEDAYTVSKTDHSSAAIEKRPKAGNGHARITYLRPLEAPPVWDGNFFNADFSTDGRDSIRYDSSRTCSVTIDTSSMEPRTALQGQMFDCMYDEPTWTLSNGVLDTGENDNAYLGWLYDYANINNRIIPTTCTFYIDMEVNFYTLDNIELGFFTPITYEDRYGSLQTVDREVFMFGFYPAGSYPPYVENEEINETGERHMYSIGNTALSMSYNEWHTVRFKVELTNGLISKITIYIDGSEVTYQEFNTSTEPIPFVCLNSNTYAEWFCRLYINRCKIRKLYIGQDIS